MRDAYVRSLLPIMMTANWGPAETSPSPCLSRHIKCCAASPEQNVASDIIQVFSSCASTNITQVLIPCAEHYSR